MNKRFSPVLIFFVVYLVFNMLEEGGTSFPSWLMILIAIGVFNAVKQSRVKNKRQEHKVEDEYSFDEFETKSEASHGYVECPYCSHMNKSGLTFCEKCNGLL